MAQKPKAVHLDSRGRESTLAAILAAADYDIVARLSCTRNGLLWQTEGVVPEGNVVLPLDALCVDRFEFTDFAAAFDLTANKVRELGATIVITGYTQPHVERARFWAKNGIKVVSPLCGWTDDQVTQGCVDNGIAWQDVEIEKPDGVIIRHTLVV